jgi:acyl-CoA thioester hydrolase
MTKKHKSSFRVYYEDTDAGGIMYHGNYINFCERGRSDMLRELGMPSSEVFEKLGIAFVVRHLDAGYLAMVKLDDLLTVETHVTKMKNTSFVMRQVITSENQSNASISPAFSMNVTIVCLDTLGKPVRIPDELRQTFTDYLEEA